MANIRCDKCGKLIVKAQVLQSVQVKCDCGHVQMVMAKPKRPEARKIIEGVYPARPA